ncbi:MAG: hypothetical protein AB1472_06825 [Candidatus Omnitrophota bacterium]
MNYQHKELAQGRWKELPLLEQMANIGSEVERALNWQTKNNPEYSRKAIERAVELLDLTLDCNAKTVHIKELARLREVLLDYFFGTNEFMSTDKEWKKYFLQFACGVRKNH